MFLVVIIMALELIVGPMFAGKTTTLISKIEIYTLTGKKCVIVRSAVDTRTDNVQTHRNLIYNGEVLKIDSLKLDNPEITKLNDYDVIGFDEGHFFNGEDLINLVQFLIQHHKLIFISMLKSDGNRAPFPFTDHLLARANNIILLKAVCEICKQHLAIHTKRKHYNNPEIFVGGSELYYPCCDDCW
jgi:thymidine kinase